MLMVRALAAARDMRQLTNRHSSYNYDIN